MFFHTNIQQIIDSSKVKTRAYQNKQTQRAVPWNPREYIFLWEMKCSSIHLTNALFVKQRYRFEFTVTNCHLLGTKWRDLCGRLTGLRPFQTVRLNARGTFSEISLCDSSSRKLPRWKSTTSLWTDSPVTLTKRILLCVSNSVGR